MYSISIIFQFVFWTANLNIHPLLFTYRQIHSQNAPLNSSSVSLFSFDWRYCRRPSRALGSARDTASNNSQRLKTLRTGGSGDPSSHDISISAFLQGEIYTFKGTLRKIMTPVKDAPVKSMLRLFFCSLNHQFDIYWISRHGWSWCNMACSMRGWLIWIFLGHWLHLMGMIICEKHLLSAPLNMQCILQI